MKDNVSQKVRSLLRNTFIVAIGSFVVAAGVYAATTIGNNLSTGGTLDVTGLTTLSSATTTSATSTDYFYVGYDITEPAGWDFSGGDLLVSGSAFFNADATSSVSFWIGSGGTANYLDLTGGDLFVQDDLQLGDALTVGGTASSTALIVGGRATTTSLVIGERAEANATSTLVLGDETAESATCIKMRTTEGSWVYGYATSTSAMIAEGYGLQWSTDSTICE